MREHSFWDDYAKAMEQTVEGNQQIARELGQWIATRWQAARREIAHELSEFDNRPKLPPL